MDRQNNAVAELLVRAATAQREANARSAGDAGRARQRQARRRTRDASVRRCYPAAATSVPLARAAVVWLAARAGMSPGRLDAVRLAVSEAVTNATVHAYPWSAGQIHLTATLADGRLTVLVADDGVGPRTPARRPGPGWGVPLMRGCADQVTISERPSGGTLVVIGWNIESAAEPRGETAARPAVTAELAEA